MKTALLILCVFALSASAFQSRFLAQDSPLVPLQNVSMAILSGDWYELDRLGFDFEANTTCSTVKLSFPENGAWNVTVTARAGSAGGKTVQTVGTMTAQGEVKNNVAAEGKFNAQFGQGPVTEFYIFAEPSYHTWVLFGSPDRKTFWLLYRKSSMNDNLLELIENIAEKNGFDSHSFVHVDQRLQCRSTISN